MGLHPNVAPEPGTRRCQDSTTLGLIRGRMCDNRPRHDSVARPDRGRAIESRREDTHSFRGRSDGATNCAGCEDARGGSLCDSRPS